MEENATYVPIDCLCRCCLTNTAQLKPIFNSVGSVPETVFVFTAIEFKKNDGLPESICMNCLDFLNKCISFKRKVETSDMILRNYLTKLMEKTIEEDTDTRTEEEGIQEEDRDPQRDEIASDQFEYGQERTNYSTGMMCRLCARSYVNKSSYNRHMKAHTSKGSSFRCNECGKRFSDKAHFQVHEKCHKQMSATSLAVIGDVIECQVCKDVFTFEQDLFVHSSLHVDRNKFNCNACGKVFENKLKLKRHIPSHFVDKPFKCYECGMEFPEMASLTRHYRKHVKSGHKSTHICSVCQKKFRNQYSLKVHFRNHTGERPWACTKCDKRFTDSRLLNSHKKLHEESKCFKCEQCNNSFRHRSTLVNHMRTHTGRRPFRCDKCKKSFKQSWSLQIHRRAHTSDKRLSCKKCSQVFSKSASLADHVQWHSSQQVTHDNDKPSEMHSESFKCKECLAEFSSCLDLIAHEKLTHFLSHECETCFGKWKTLDELEKHICDKTIELPDEPAPEEMILLPNGEIRDCHTIVNALLATISNSSTLPDFKKSKDNVN